VTCYEKSARVFIKGYTIGSYMLNKNKIKYYYASIFVRKRLKSEGEPEKYKLWFNLKLNTTH